MTWMRIRPELFGQAAADGLSADAVMAHCEALGWLYAHERDDCVISARLLRSALVLTEDAPTAVKALDSAGYWTARTDGSVEIVDHADVVRGSLHATRMKRRKDQRAQAKARARAASDGVSADDAADDTADESAPRLPNYLPNYLAVRETGQERGGGGVPPQRDGDADMWPKVARGYDK